jgi:hypothetical protein
VGIPPPEEHHRQSNLALLSLRQVEFQDIVV